MIKYFDPLVSNGHLNWDQELLHALHVCDSLQSASASCDYLLSRCSTYGSRKGGKSPKYSPRLQWINTDQNLLANHHERLFSMVELKRTFPHRYLKTRYVSEVVPAEPDSVEWRFGDPYCSVLALARYWNTMQYFNPYLEMLDPWESVLDEMLPIFLAIQNELEYDIALRQLNARIRDSHALDNVFPMRGNAPFREVYAVRDIALGVSNDTVFVAAVENSSVANIEKGDILLGMDGKELDFWLDSISTIGSFSYRDVARMLRFIKVSSQPRHVWHILREGKRIEIPVTYALIKIGDATMAMQPPVDIPKNMAYIQAEDLKTGDVKTAFRLARQKQGLILDMRGYGEVGVMASVGEILSKRGQKFAAIHIPDPEHPGVFQRRFVRTSLWGRRYRKPVVILVSNETQSAAEYTVMKAQTNARVIVVGTHTAGANGNVVTMPMPAEYAMVYSSIGVYYPDGTPNQQLGIKLDYVVKASVKECISTDPILVEGIRVLGEQIAQ